MKTSNDVSPRVLIVAAEASSSLYAQRLLEYWREQDLKVHAFGVGSRAMEVLGFECIGRSEEMAVVGLQEVLAHWGLIRSVFKGLVSAAKESRPDVVLLLDYPEFNLRLAKEMNKLGIPVVYYISPQIWAWRQSRVKIIQKRVDKMLVLFPFEVDFYKKHGVDVEFVGHPLLDELERGLLTSEQRQIHRSRYGLEDKDLLLALMPGSRRSELKHHLQVQLDVAQNLVAHHKDLKLALLVAPTFDKEELRSQLSNMECPIILIQDDPFRMIQMSDIVLCASGTATLMVGLMEKPMVIMYKMNSMSAFVAKRFVRTTKFFGMINLILGKEAVPEFFQEQANLENLSQALERYVEDSSLRVKVAGELSLAKAQLGSRGATERVAKALEPYWQRAQGPGQDAQS